MKIISALKNIILENRSNYHRLFTSKDGVKFFATPHQTKDRKGHLSYDEIKDIILNAIDSGSNVHTRVGVPNRMLSRLIKDKYPKILDGLFSNTKDERIKFVHKRQDNEDEEVFDYIEFIVARDNNDSFSVISSTFSENGNYLKNFGKNAPQTKKIILEKYFHIKTILL